MRTFYGMLVLTTALAVAGCDNDVENATPPTTPAPTTTETFTGTIKTNGAMTHTFTTAASGTVTATLTDVTPDPAIAVGFTIGTFNGSSCLASMWKDDALRGNSLIATVSGAGTLCARIHDTGKVTGDLNYTLTIIHP